MRMRYQTKAYYSVTNLIQYNIVIGFGIHAKSVNLIKHVSIKPTVKYENMDMQNLFDTFAIKNGQKAEDALLSWLFNFALGY